MPRREGLPERKELEEQLGSQALTRRPLLRLLVVRKVDRFDHYLRRPLLVIHVALSQLVDVRAALAAAKLKPLLLRTEVPFSVVVEVVGLAWPKKVKEGEVRNFVVLYLSRNSNLKSESIPQNKAKCLSV